jgi:hypothetical protein
MSDDVKTTLEDVKTMLEKFIKDNSEREEKSK